MSSMSYSLFLGFASVSVSERKEFKDQIQQLYKKVNSRLDEGQTIIIEPRFYYLFGDYDLLVLSLMNDFDFALRTFTPYNPDFSGNNKNVESINFDHQIILTSFPDSSNNCSDPTSFYKTIDKFPLVSVTRVKLSSYFLMEQGLNFVNNVSEYIKKIMSHEDSNIGGSDSNTNFVVTLQSYSWNELTIVTFSNSYSPIVSNLTKLRSSTYSVMKKKLEIESRTDIQKNQFGIGDEHYIIKNTHTTLGFNANIDFSDYIFLNDEPVFPVIQLLLKKVNIEKLISKLQSDFKDFFVKKSVGKTDLILYPKENLGIPLNNLIKLILEVFPNYSAEIISNNTIICIGEFTESPNRNDGISDQSISSSILSNQKTSFSVLLDRLVVPPFIIESVIDKLRRARIPKLIRDGIVNLFGEYNCGVKDTMLYSYFFELTPFVISLYKEIEDLSVSELSKKRDHFELTLVHFKNSFDNRFQQSFVTNDVTDNNFFFKGGIQGFLSIYAMIYEAYASKLGNPQGLVSVQGHSGIISDKLGISLNYLHIVQPIVVINHVIYEITINFISRLAEEDSKQINDHLYPKLLALVKEGKASEEIPYQNIMHGLPDTSAKLEILFDKDDYVEELGRMNLEIYWILTNPENLLHFVADCIVFELLFKEDFDKLYFLYFGLFASFPSSGEKLNEYSHQKVIEFLCRISLIELYAKKKGIMTNLTVKSYSFFFDEENAIRFEQIKSTYASYFEVFFESKEISGLFNEIEEIITFEIGKIIDDAGVPFDSVNDFLHKVIEEFNYYLGVLKSDTWYSPTQKSVYKRGPTNSSSTNENPYLFDQLGGYFIRDQQKRGEYLNLRLKTINKLLDATLNYKYTLCIKLSDENFS